MKKFMDVMFYLGAAFLIAAAAVAVLITIYNYENIIVYIAVSIAAVAGLSLGVSSVGYNAANEEHKNTNK